MFLCLVGKYRSMRDKPLDCERYNSKCALTRQTSSATQDPLRRWSNFSVYYTKENKNSLFPSPPGL